MFKTIAIASIFALGVAATAAQSHHVMATLNDANHPVGDDDCPVRSRPGGLHVNPADDPRQPN